MNLETIQQLTAALSSVLLDVALKGAAVMLIAVLITGLMRRSRPAARHLVWACSLTMMAAIPFLPGWHVLPQWMGATSPSLARPAATEVAAGNAPINEPGEPIAPATSPREMSRDSVPREAAPPIAHPKTAIVQSPLGWKQWLVLIWLLGVLASIIPLIVARLKLIRLSSRSSREPDPQWHTLTRDLSSRLGLSRRVRLLFSRDTVMPMTWGIFRPVIVLPDSSANWSPVRRRVVLLHELSHVKRLDCLWLLIGKLARAVHWFNPLVWWGVAKLRTEAEHACDDRVLHAGEAPPEYAEQLLQIVASLGNTRTSDVLAFGMARPSTLETRVRSILSDVRTRRLTIRSAIGLLILLAAVLIPLSMLKTARQQTAGPRKIAILVVSVDGLPKALATITDKLDALPIATTDASGRCEITVTTQEPVTWYAQSQNAYSCGIFTVPSGAVDHPLTVQLNLKKGAWYGRVTDPQGRGISGAKVVARVDHGEGQFVESAPHASDSAGYYEFGAVPISNGLSLQVRLSPGDVPPGPWSPSFRTGPHQNEIYLPDLVDPRAKGLSEKPAWVTYGGFVKTADGKPVSDAEVDVHWKIPEEIVSRGRAAVSDATGRWTVLMPPDAEVSYLQATHPQFVIQSGNVNATGPSPARLRDRTAVIVLRQGVPLTGIVRDDQGNPASDVLVITRQEGSIGMLGPIQDPSMGRSGKDGTFRVENMDPGPRRLTTWSNQYATASADTNIQAGMKPVELVVSRGGSVNGIVLDAQGKPVAGAYVSASSINAEGRRNSSRRSVSDAGGHFRIEGLATSGSLSLSATSGASGSGTLKDIKIRSEPYEITLAPRPTRPTGTQITVLDDASGAPITHYRLFDGPQFEPGATPNFSEGLRYTVVSKDGKYIRRGGYTRPITGLALRVIADGYLTADSPVVAGGETKEYVLRLKAGAPFTGTILDPAGAPASEAQVAWVSPGRQAFLNANGLMSEQFLASPEVMVKTTSEGRFDLPPGMPAGTIVAVHAKGYAQIDSVKVQSGGQIKLTPWARVEGHLTRGNQTLSNVRMGIYPVDDFARSRNAPVNWMLSAVTEPDGSFVFEHVPTIPLAVGFSERSGLASRVLIDPRPGATETIRIGGTGRDVIATVQMPARLAMDQVYSEFQPGRPQAIITLRPTSDSADESDKVHYLADPRRLFFAGQMTDAHHLVIHDVPPGDYILRVQILSAGQGRSSPPKPIAKAEQPINVTPGSAPLDAGEVRLSP